MEVRAACTNQEWEEAICNCKEGILSVRVGGMKSSGDDMRSSEGDADGGVDKCAAPRSGGWNVDRVGKCESRSGRGDVNCASNLCESRSGGGEAFSASNNCGSQSGGDDDVSCNDDHLFSYAGPGEGDGCGQGVGSGVGDGGKQNFGGRIRTRILSGGARIFGY